MKISLDKNIFKSFHPKYKLIFISIKDLDNKSKLKESKHLLKEIQQLIKLTFNKDTIKSHHLISPWEVAKQEFGKKARHYHTSVEKSLKKTLANRTISTNNAISNLVNYLQLRHIVPISSDDYFRIDSNLSFKLASGRERKGVLGKLHKNEIYYKDKTRILGTNLDYWHSKKTAITPYTNDALIHFAVLPPITTQKINAIVKETKELIQAFCGGKVKTLILDKNKLTGTI